MSITSTSRCASCSTTLLGGERFCGGCGAPVAFVGSAPAPVDGQGNSPWDVILRQLRAATLGEFEIKRELGRGGMAAVFLAHEIALNRKVALKVMAPGLMLGEGMVERFRFEAVTIANLTHPHIVRIHAVRQAAEMHFFVMQYLAGRSLERIVRVNGPLAIPVIRTLLAQVGGALGYAHRRGVIHRDVKPANILFDSTGDAIVTDFGIAKVAEEPSQTLAGSVVGTPSYMSPEQCYAHELTGASDQYSLGIVAFEMLTGSAPFLGPAYTVMQGHTHGEIPSITALRPDCPRDLEATVRRMLARKPEDRFASMAEAVKAIGAGPLGDHDALRDELIVLAALEENAAQDAAVPTPRSPIPQSRPMLAGLTPTSPAEGVSGAAGSEAPARQPSTARWWLLAVPAVAIIGAVVLFRTRSGDQLATAPLPGSASTQVRQADSIAVPATRAIRATDSGTTPTLVAPRELPTVAAAKPVVVPPLSKRARANDAIKPGVTVSAPARTPVPAPVEPQRDPPLRTVPPTALPAVTPVVSPAAPPEAPPRPAERPAKSTAELRGELDATVRAYAQAIESRDFGRLRSAFPAILQSQLDAYRTFFDFARDVKISINRIEVADPLTGTVGNEVRARVDYTIQYRNNSTRRDEREKSEWQAVLLRTTTGWRLITLR